MALVALRQHGNEGNKATRMQDLWRPAATARYPGIPAAQPMPRWRAGPRLPDGPSSFRRRQDARHSRMRGAGPGFTPIPQSPPRQPGPQPRTADHEPASCTVPHIANRVPTRIGCADARSMTFPRKRLVQHFTSRLRGDAHIGGRAGAGPGPSISVIPGHYVLKERSSPRRCSRACCPAVRLRRAVVARPQ